MAPFQEEARGWLDNQQLVDEKKAEK